MSVDATDRRAAAAGSDVFDGTVLPPEVLPPAPPRNEPDETPFSRLGLHGAKVLLVASTGGHLAQISQIATVIGVDRDSVLCTSRGGQALALESTFRMQYVDYVPPRGALQIAKAGRRVAAILRAERFDAVLSTGAGIALAALPQAAARGVPAYFVESVSRFEGPSMSGRILRYVPRVRTWTQHPSWAGGAWRDVGGSVMEIAVPQRTDVAPVPRRDGPLRVFVTLGTIRPFRFDALVDRVLEVLPEGAVVTWQLGSTIRADLPGKVHQEMPHGDFDAAIDDADVIVSHAGAGTMLGVARKGRVPILVPRRVGRGEHVDDHQLQVCRDADRRGLARYREADQLTAADLVPDR